LIALRRERWLRRASRVDVGGLLLAAAEAHAHLPPAELAPVLGCARYLALLELRWRHVAAERRFAALEPRAATAAECRRGEQPLCCALCTGVRPLSWLACEGCDARPLCLGCAQRKGALCACAPARRRLLWRVAAAQLQRLVDLATVLAQPAARCVPRLPLPDSADELLCALTVRARACRPRARMRAARGPPRSAAGGRPRRRPDPRSTRRSVASGGCAGRHDPRARSHAASRRASGRRASLPRPALPRPRAPSLRAAPQDGVWPLDLARLRPAGPRPPAHQLLERTAAALARARDAEGRADGESATAIA
jgi:hypothetical protein